MVVEFHSEPATDFTNQENQQAFKDALIKVKSEFGKEIPLVINVRRFIQMINLNL